MDYGKYTCPQAELRTNAVATAGSNPGITGCKLQLATQPHRLLKMASRIECVSWVRNMGEERLH